MAKGGARAQSGPAPDPNALRRERDSGDWVTLPAAGREGPAPEWPLTEVSERESHFWNKEWRRPQALMWERQDQVLEVAIYVRTLAVAEQTDASVAVRTLLRQQMEALGISIPGLARNRWRIEDGERATAAPTPIRSGVGGRERFKVVSGGAAAG